MRRYTPTKTITRTAQIVVLTWFIAGLLVLLNGIAGSSGESSAANTGSAGGGAAHNNLQPYLVLNYIIRAA